MAIVHAWSLYAPPDADGRRRHAIAQSTWGKQPWIEMPISDGQLPRLFNENGHNFPFIRDLFDAACLGRKADDIIIYTNADIGMVSNACIRIAIQLNLAEAGYAFRRDLHIKVTHVPPDQDILQWHHYPGSDVFFFRVRWWKKHGSQMPDMIPAREAWDPCLRILIDDTNDHPQMALPNLCWHERHGKPSGYWEDPNNRYTLPGQIHNLRLAKSFMLKQGRNPSQFGVR